MTISKGWPGLRQQVCLLTESCEAGDERERSHRIVCTGDDTGGGAIPIRTCATPPTAPEKRSLAMLPCGVSTSSSMGSPILTTGFGDEPTLTVAQSQRCTGPKLSPAVCSKLMQRSLREEEQTIEPVQGKSGKTNTAEEEQFAMDCSALWISMVKSLIVPPSATDRDRMTC